MPEHARSLLLKSTREWHNALAVPFVAAFAATFVLEMNWTGKAYNLAVCFALAGILLLWSRRLSFSIAAASYMCAWVWMVSELKYRYLGFHLVSSDFGAAADAWHVIAPFLIPWAVVTLIAIGGLAVIFGRESAHRLRRSGWLWATSMLLLCPGIAANFVQVDFGFLKPRANSLPIFIQGMYRLSFTPAHLGKPTFCCQKADPAAGKFTKSPEPLPDIIVILSESFFDPRSISGFHPTARIPKGFMPLRVYTVGGQTWIQEIAVLHGVPPPVYGSSWPQINLFAAGKKIDGRLPGMLKAQGYTATTVYPVNGMLYGSRAFHLAFGMDRFFDCLSIPGCADKSWVNRPDRMFYEFATQILESATGPQFLFVATMHQHSPHDPSLPLDPARCGPDLTQVQCSVMQDYDNRLKDCLNDYAELLDRLRHRSGRSLVLLFGDHIPADVAYYFNEDSFPEHDRYRTLFDIWDSQRGHVAKKAVAAAGVSRPVEIAFLDALLLSEAGFDSTYLHDKLEFLHAGNGRYSGDARRY